MAVVSIEGLLEIDLADVHGWLASEHDIQAAVTRLDFSLEENGLVLSLEGRSRPVIIDSVDLWLWVGKHHLPASLQSYETLYGVPKLDPSRTTLSISFAASNHCDPASWRQAPACLEEWSKLRSPEPRA